MKSFVDYIAEKWELKMPEGMVPGSWFKDNHIPMVVRALVVK